MARAFGTGLWRLADPKVSLASFAAMALGACAAARDGAISAVWLLLTAAGIFAIEVAKNASGEIVDFDSGADLSVAPEDRSPFSGGKRVLVDGLLSRRETVAIATAAYALGIAAGLVIALGREPRVLAFGVAGLAAAFFYHSPPVRLSYRGLGEIAVGVTYGPLVTAGTYLVQRGSVAPRVLWLSIPLGLLIADFLIINEFPDARSDARAGKRTLVVRFGRRRAAALYGAVAVAAFLILAVLPALGVPRGVWLGGIGLLPAVPAAMRLAADPGTTSRIVPAQGLSLLAFLLLAVGSGVGLLAWP